MTSDLQKRRVQERYKEKLKQKKGKKRHTLEAVIVICLLLLLLPLLPIIDENVVYENNPTERMWSSVIPEIDGELERTFSNYKGIAIDFNPEPVKIIVRTSIQEKSAIINQGEIIIIVNEMIKSYNIPNQLRENETYEVIIKGNNNKTIDRKLFH